MKKSFLEQLQNENLSPNTIMSYTFTIRHFFSIFSKITKNNLNNILLRKLRIALAFKSYDMIEVFKLGGVDISEAELNALFRSEDHRNYKECGDKYIRVFLKGLIEYCRD